MHRGTEGTANIENSKFEDSINTYRGWVCFFSVCRVSIVCIRQGLFNATVGASLRSGNPRACASLRAQVLGDGMHVCDANSRSPMN